MGLFLTMTSGLMTDVMAALVLSAKMDLGTLTEADLPSSPTKAKLSWILGSLWASAAGAVAFPLLTWTTSANWLAAKDGTFSTLNL